MELIKKGAPQYKANLHCHSTLSDGGLDPEELKVAYKNAGYSVLAITDHEYPYDHSAMSEEDFLMLTGYEAYIRKYEDGRSDVYVPEIHINLIAKEPHNLAYICFNDPYCKYAKDPDVRKGFKKVGSSEIRRYDVDYVNAFVKTALENGYLCTHNHPTWSLEEWDYIKNYEGFFSMEMCNYSSYLQNGTEYNGDLYDRILRTGKRIFCHSADDNHNHVPLDSPASDSFGGFTMIMAKSLEYGAVIDALERGDFYSSMGPRFEHIEISDGKIIIEATPSRQITVNLGGRRMISAHGSAQNPLTRITLDMPSRFKYLRFTATDFEGNHADTRAFFPEEIL